MQKRNARKKGLQGYRTLKHSFCIHINQENEYQIQYIKCILSDEHIVSSVLFHHALII